MLICTFFLPSLHNDDVKISRFLDDVNTRHWLSFSFPDLRYILLEFSSRKDFQHLTNWTRWNKCDKVWSSASHFLSDVFEAVAVSRFCLSFLLINSSAMWHKIPIRAKYFIYLLSQECYFEWPEHWRHKNLSTSVDLLPVLGLGIIRLTTTIAVGRQSKSVYWYTR